MALVVRVGTLIFRPAHVTRPARKTVRLRCLATEHPRTDATLAAERSLAALSDDAVAELARAKWPPT
jgi:hypothetical protein